MKFTNLMVGVLAASLTMASAAQAANVEVLPGDPSWSTGGNSGGGSSAITGTAPRSGTGSLELHGDRTRFTHIESLGALSNATGLGFDWMIDAGSSNNLDPDYTPALRLLITNGQSFREMIWEGAYNGVYGPQTNPGVWYTAGALTSKFYIGSGNENFGKTIADWAQDATYGNYQIYGISIGVGSSASAGYQAYADNVRFVNNGGETTWNFNVAGAVPEPATWAMMIIGFGAVGSMVRRRRTIFA